jgi:hypothetical protein
MITVFYLINYGIVKNHWKIGGKINSIAWRKRLALRSILKITEFELDRDWPAGKPT